MQKKKKHFWVTFTGWSASSSEPYMRTRFAALSKSAIFCGNQGAFANASAYKKIILHTHVGRSYVIKN